MGIGFVIMVFFLLALVVLGFPTPRRIERAFQPKPGPHPVVRWARSGRERARRWRRRRQRRRLRSI